LRPAFGLQDQLVVSFLVGREPDTLSFVVLSAAEVERLLPMDECIDVVAEALVALEQGEMTQPLRSIFVPPSANGAMAWMPAHRGGAQPLYGMKVLCVIPDNPSRGLDGHQGQVLLADGVTGQLRALLDASAVTAVRTAAVSALATRLLARADARVLAIVGTGVQARTHLDSIPLVRPIEHVRIAGRSPERARQFVAEVEDSVPFTVVPSATVEEAVRGADVVVTATTSREPVLTRAWLEPGTHVNAVGASQPTSRELDTQTVADSLLFTDRRESLENEAAEYALALEEGLVFRSHLRAELGELLTGKAEGRTSADQLTLFRSLGLAVFDVAAASHVVAKAHERGAGRTIEL
jgi:ornithine cyclodeaminase/alanine dehydrogenase-like protein (mu-crystallin family)